jgi:hypothetical protein
MDLVMIRPPCIEVGAFVVSPDSVWYARGLLFFSASAKTDTGLTAFDFALVSTFETYDDDRMIPKTVIIVIVYIMVINTIICLLLSL